MSATVKKKKIDILFGVRIIVMEVCDANDGGEFRAGDDIAPSPGGFVIAHGITSPHTADACGRSRCSIVFHFARPSD